MIHFTSDSHFGHFNIVGPKISKWKDGYRDFDSLEEMNTTLIKTINKYVKKDDVLYFLGDFAFGNHKNIPKYRESIDCETIHFIKGNHDKHIDLYKHLFISINDVLWCEERQDRPIFMSHYSHRVWKGNHKGTIHLYAHSHGSIPDYGKSMDVGVDVAYRMFGEYRPFNIEEIINIMDKRKPEFVDHHKN